MDQRRSSRIDRSNQDDSSITPIPPSTTTTTTTTITGPQTTTTTTAGPRSTTTTVGPGTTTITGPTTTTTTLTPRRPAPPAPPTLAVPSTAQRSASTVRIRRLPSTPSVPQLRSQIEVSRLPEDNAESASRRRSNSAPQRPQLSAYPPNDLDIRRQVTASSYLPALQEETSGHGTPQLLLDPSNQQPGRFRRASAAARSMLTRQNTNNSINALAGPLQEYDSRIIDMLDVIDPEVATLNTLNNVQNSLFIPYLGNFYSRRPTYDLSRHSPDTSDEEIGVALSPPDYDSSTAGRRPDQIDYDKEEEEPPGLSRSRTTQSISSVLTSMSEGHNFAVLPHGTSLEGWSPEDKAELNDHVRHLLHSRRAKFKRGMRGFGKYVRKPVGFLVTLYAFLLTFWGAAWVLFLIGWISVGDRQAYFVEICDQILTALFCVVGIGFAPFRAVDTYHMIYIAHYHRLTWRLRRERALPDLKDHNDLPALPNKNRDVELGLEKDDEEPEGIVLTHEQQQKLEYHQAKFCSSHTFYKPHETTTHHAFSLRLLIAIVVLLDCHSLFQMALGGTTWGINYHHRPKALTAVILSCSISCNISAGITIMVGDRKSRKKLVVEQMFRQGLTEEALTKLSKEKGLKASGLKTTIR